MMGGAVEADYYEILQVDQTATSGEVKRSYHRLCRIRHPDKDRSNPNAHQAFATLQNAYEVIIDPVQRRAYNIRYERVKIQRQTEQVHKEERERTKKQADEARRKAKAEENGIEERYKEKSGALWEIKRAIGVIERQQDCWKKEEDEQIAKRKAENGWIPWLFGKKKAPMPTEDEQIRAEQQRLQLEAVKRIKAAELQKKRQSYSQVKQELDRIDDIRKRLKAKRVEEENQEALRQRRERLKREEKVREEERQRRAKVEEEARKAREKREREDAEAIEALREALREEEAHRQAQAAKQRQQQRQRYQGERQGSTATRTACTHAGWWSKVNGCGTCEKCSDVHRQWILQCPRCQMQACARCRPILQGKSGHRREFRQPDRVADPWGDDYDSFF